MTEIDHEKLASLMAAGKGLHVDPEANKRPFFNRSRVLGWGAVAALGAVALNGLRGEAKREAALEALRSSVPHHSPDPALSAGLEEIVSIRRPGAIPINPEFSRNYLSALLEASPAEEVIATQGAYRHSRDPNTGQFIEDPKVKILQALVMGESEADGLFGTKTAAAFRAALRDAEITGVRIGAPPSSDTPIQLTVQDAKDLINYSMMFNSEVRKRVQSLLVEQQYDIGRAGVDGRIGPDTEQAFSRYQEDRGLGLTTGESAVNTSALVAAVMEGRPEYRAVLSAQIQGEQWYKELPKAWQELVQQKIQREPARDLAVFEYLVDSPGFQSLTPEQLVQWGVTEEPNLSRSTGLQCEALQLFHSTDFEGRCHMVNVFHRTNTETGKPTILEANGERDEYNRPKVVLDYLYDLAVDEFRPKDKPHRQAILSGCLAELDPFNINQGRWGRCGGDVVQYDLFLRYPEQAAKIAAAAFSLEQAAAETRPGPTPIAQEDGYDPTGEISPVEARIQAWCMEIGDPKLRYDVQRDCQVDPITGERKGRGLSSDEIAQLTTELTGEEHWCYRTADRVRQADLMLVLRAAEPGDKFSFFSRYLDQDEIAQLSDEERRGRSVVRSSHIVNFVGYDDASGEILFRTWGQAPAVAGTVLPSHNGSLEKRIVDQERGIYAVRAEELAKVIHSVILRARDDIPHPETVDHPWQFPDIVTDW